MTEGQARADLVLAQRGDVKAQGRVALHCYDRYLPRLLRLAADNRDPVMGVDDMKMTFFEGCMAAVLVADGRGDDLYHIGQRGIWAVQSELRAVRRAARAHAAAWRALTADGEEIDPIENAQDPSAADAFERAEDAIDARQRISVLTAMPLKGRLREAVDYIATVDDDPRSIGFGVRMASSLDVSRQRVSQIMGELRGLAA